MQRLRDQLGSFTRDSGLTKSLDRCYTRKDAQATVDAHVDSEISKLRSDGLQERVSEAIRKSSWNNKGLLSAKFPDLRAPSESSGRPDQGWLHRGGISDTAPPRYTAEAAEPVVAGPAYPRCHAGDFATDPYELGPNVVTASSSRPQPSGAEWDSNVSATISQMETLHLTPDQQAQEDAAIDKLNKRLDALGLDPLSRYDMAKNGKRIIQAAMRRSEAALSQAREQAPLDDEAAYAAFSTHLGSVDLRPEVKQLVQDIGFPMIQAALQMVDIKLYVDCSASTKIDRLNDAIRETAVILAAVSVPFDEDGIEIHYMSDVRRPPRADIRTPEDARSAFEGLVPEGGTPMASGLKEIYDDYLTRLIANEAMPKSHQVKVKKLRVLLIGDGIPENDYQLRVGIADGRGSVLIDGVVPAPEDAAVAGPITAANKVSKETNIPGADPVIEREIPVQRSDVDQETRDVILAMTGNDVYSPNYHTDMGHVDGLSIADNKLKGKVLVRVPHNMEQVLVNASVQFKKARYPSTQVGLALIPVGKDPGVKTMFDRLNNLPDQDKYRDLGLRDMVSYVPTPEGADHNGERLAGYVILSAASCGNRTLDNTNVEDVIRENRQANESDED